MDSREEVKQDHRMEEGQGRLPYLDTLVAYSQEETTHFDVPGHKQGRGIPILRECYGMQVLRMDLNGPPRLDHLAHPQTVLREAKTLMADAYGADEAFLITSGTTCAIHAMMLAALQPGDKVLLPRNIHKSAINGLILTGAIPIYLEADFLPQEGIMGNVSLTEVQKKLGQHPDAKAIFLLNPTYYGFTAPLQDIVSLCHQQGLLVLVDEAHGAHFPFHRDLPLSAMAAGADLAAVSLHKTGGAMTQASILLVNQSRISAAKVEQTVSLLHSTSPSALLLGSLDGARQNLALHGREQLEKALALALDCRKRLTEIEGIYPLWPQDLTKIPINVTGLGLSGFEVFELMWRQFNIELEMGDMGNVLAIISLGDHLGAINQLVDAFQHLSAHRVPAAKHEPDPYLARIEPVVVLSPRDAFFSQKILVPITDAAGYLAGESIMAYPPGSPLVAPGEQVTAALIETLLHFKSSGARLIGQYDPLLDYLLVLKDIFPLLPEV